MTPSRESILKVVDVLFELGSHAETNGPYQAGLTQRIQQAGPIEALTVGELLQICRDHSAFFNRLFADSRTG